MMPTTGIATEAIPSPGRSCPLHYRYHPSALAEIPEQSADTLYVVGGLYGNQPALAALTLLAAQEPSRSPAGHRNHQPTCHTSNVLSQDPTTAWPKRRENNP